MEYYIQRSVLYTAFNQYAIGEDESKLTLSNVDDYIMVTILEAYNRFKFIYPTTKSFTYSRVLYPEGFTLLFSDKEVYENVKMMLAHIPSKDEYEQLVWFHAKY